MFLMYHKNKILISSHAALILISMIHQVTASPSADFSETKYTKRPNFYDHINSYAQIEVTNAMGSRTKREVHHFGVNNVGSCRSHNTCNLYQWCENNKCKNPCHPLDCEQRLPNSICRIENHLPVCKLHSELTPEQLYENNGCLSNRECGEKEWCMHHKCEEACSRVDCESWSNDGYCDVIDHNSVCRFKTFGVSEAVEENLVEPRLKGDECIASFQCEHHLACLSEVCDDPCDLVWCMTEGIDNPAFLVPKSKYSMDNYFNDKHNCIVEHHLVQCVPDES